MTAKPVGGLRLIRHSCSVRNKMLVERNNRSSPNCATPYGVECGGGDALFYQYMNPDGVNAKFCKSPVAEARNFRRMNFFLPAYNVLKSFFIYIESDSFFY